MWLLNLLLSFLLILLLTAVTLNIFLSNCHIWVHANNSNVCTLTESKASNCLTYSAPKLDINIGSWKKQRLLIKARSALLFLLILVVFHLVLLVTQPKSVKIQWLLNLNAFQQRLSTVNLWPLNLNAPQWMCSPANLQLKSIILEESL